MNLVLFVVLLALVILVLPHGPAAGPYWRWWRLRRELAAIKAAYDAEVARLASESTEIPAFRPELAAYRTRLNDVRREIGCTAPILLLAAECRRIEKRLADPTLRHGRSGFEEDLRAFEFWRKTRSNARLDAIVGGGLAVIFVFALAIAVYIGRDGLFP